MKILHVIFSILPSAFIRFPPVSSKYEHDNASRRILVGSDCEQDEFSHLVLIIENKRLFCGGSLLNDEWVLTAAHCCDSMVFSKYYSVRVGAQFWNKEAEQMATIQAVYINRFYKAEPLNSDICILHLRNKIAETSNVRFANLSSKATFEYMIQNDECTSATVMGFGLQKMNNQLVSHLNDTYNNHVQCTTLQVLNTTDCFELYSDLITVSIFCAKDPTNAGRDACQGDSGGPIMCKGLQIGIVSAGIGCGIPDYPGLYNRVDMYEDFINKIIKQNRISHSKRRNAHSEGNKSNLCSAFYCIASLEVVIYFIMIREIS